MKLPTVYFQIKKIKSFWLKSNSPQKDEMVKIFDEYLKQIEKDAEADDFGEIVEV